jgi:hypothetical protein
MDGSVMDSVLILVMVLVEVVAPHALISDWREEIIGQRGWVEVTLGAMILKSIRQ